MSRADTFLSLALLVILFVARTPSVQATVGLEYLGVYPMQPQPLNGLPQVLQAGATIGNTGNETAVYTFSLAGLSKHFTYTFSNNSFMLNPAARLSFTANFTFDPLTTPILNYTATLRISAFPAVKSAVGGGTSFTVPVFISAIYIMQAGSTLTTETQVTAASTQTTTSSVSATTSSTTSSTTNSSQIGSFSLSVTPQTLAIVHSSTGIVSVTVSSVSGFSAPVTLTAANVPPGMSVTISPNPVTPPAGGSISTSASIAVDKSVTPGTYSFTISATSSSLQQQTVAVSVQVSECLIATATYGSALSPEVQFLRDFRDHRVLKTNAGSNFMLAFNAWYYSFSPIVARFIAEHSLARSVALVVLNPLIAILRAGAAAFDLTPGNPEAAAVVSGLVVSSVVGITYLSVPTYVVLRRSSRVRRIIRKILPSISALLLGSIAMVILGEFLTSQTWLMITATAASVLISLTASALVVGSGLFKIEEGLRYGISRLKRFRPLGAFRRGR